MKIRLLVSVVILGVVAALAWGAIRMVRAAAAPVSTEIPTTRIKKGPVTIFVAARGELQGGNSEMLTAPMVGGQDMAITELRAPGELVKEGDVVVQFDTTQQEFNLREAEADLAEAEQQVIQAESLAQSGEEEARYQVLATAFDVKIAELEVRRNPVLEKIKGRQNEIALEAAQNKAKQAAQDAENKKATATASVEIHKAAQNKATVLADSARKIIESMTLKAKTSGYVNIQLNQNQNMMWWGMVLPPFQLGDTARAGQAVAQIPDLKNWEVSANVGELDRGHLTAGQKVTVAVVALSGKQFAGRVKSMGGTAGPPWDRKFETRITLDQAGPELRPGMTSNLRIMVDTLNDVLWVPSQALFERDGRSFVYMQTPSGFVPHDVTLVRRSESQAVLSGVKEGDPVAMSNPDQQTKPAAAAGGAMKALGK